MKRLIFFAVVAYMFYAGVTNFTEVSETGVPMETPFAGLSITGFAFPERTTGVPPTKEWKQILVGTWKYKTIMEDDATQKRFEGEVSYFSDGKFTRTVQLSSYGKKYKEIYYKAGGKVNGTWLVSDSTWIEKIEHCNIQTGYDQNGRNEKFSPCSAYFNNTSTYGVQTSDLHEFNITSFNNSKISFQAKDLTDGFIDRWTFTKSSD